MLGDDQAFYVAHTLCANLILPVPRDSVLWRIILLFRSTPRLTLNGISINSEH